MRVALINGSPKIKNSASGAILKDLESYFPENVTVQTYDVHTEQLSDGVIEELFHADAWVFSFPLYVDGIPGHLLSCLAQLEAVCERNCRSVVYGIVNCGFYEGIQNETALKILQNWCEKTGLTLSGGIGIGGGGAMGMLPEMEREKGPKAPINLALRVLAERIFLCKTQENCYVSLAMPRLFYKAGAQMGWRQMIRANGGRIRDLGKKMIGS